MTFVRIAASDLTRVTDFLRVRSEYVMFPLNNLVRFGLDGNDALAPRMWRGAGGDITDVLTITKAGMVLPYLPSGNFNAAAKALAGRTIIGIIGPADHARGLQSALGLSGAQMELDAHETHFALDLNDLVIPDGTTHIIPLSPDLRPTLSEWMIDYNIKTLGMTPDAAISAEPERLDRELAENRRVILMDGDTPVSATAFNAALPHIVQIGAVYTPPALRGKGHARRAVALHLAQARKNGVTQATLFADNPSAIAAYEAIGFRQIGAWCLAIFKTPQVAP